ncbi:MAG: carbohydrate ABC transporter permease [Chloroflexota bacterium]
MPVSSSAPPSAHRFPQKRLRWIDIQEQLTGYLFVFPAVLLITVFGFFPIGYAFYMSLYTWRVRKGGFVGAGNYLKAVGDWTGLALFVLGALMFVAAYFLWRRGGQLSSIPWRRWAWRFSGLVVLAVGGALFSRGWGTMMASGDQSFLRSLPITLYYSLGTVPLELALALVLAYLLYQNIRAKEFFRMIYFLPYITPLVATAVVFRTIFNPRDTSLANQFAGLFGWGPFKWLFEPKPFTQVAFGADLEGFLAGPSMALVATMIFGIWTFVGYNTVIFLAGLGSIPGELYEAAEIDGANKWDAFRHITIPLLSPVTFYLALVAFIGTFKAFNHLYVMRTPAAQSTLNVASVSIFDTFYKANQYGYAAAQAILLFLLILALTQIQNKVFGEKVFYG